MPNLIASDQQRPDVGTVVSLFTIDATATGGGVHRFVPGPFQSEPVTYQTHKYTPLPVVIKGIAYGGSGAVARPTLTASKLSSTILSGLIGSDRLRGARLTRLRTLTEYLDGQTGADPERHWPLDIYRIERMSKQDSSETVWQLASPLDFEGKKLPGRQVLRDVCGWQYRRWDGKKFVYENVQCPYVGSKYFDVNDVAVTVAADDKCSRRLSGCQARFGVEPLPFGGFAGVARLRRK